MPPSPNPPASPHAVDPDVVLASLQTSARGLSSDEAQRRLARYGPNRLSEGRRRGPLARFLGQFHNVLIYVLLVAAGVTALLGEWVDTGVILGVVVINAVVGFIQEGKAEQALAAIRRMLSLRSIVLRDGEPRTVPAETLVPGDIVLLASGDRIPADLRLLRVKSLRIDEAALTGESLAVEKNTAPVAADAPLGDRAGMAYSGTFVTYGQGRGVVAATGDATELGRISGLLAGVERVETPLLRKLAVFGRWLSVAIILLAAGAYAFGTLVRGESAADMFMAAVGLAVAAIPEGLPAIITIALAIGVRRMAQRNAIIRLLPSVETLGGVTVICSDKTGTLTRNEMTVQSLVTGSGGYRVSGVGYAPVGEFLLDGAPAPPESQPELTALLRAGLLCNDARLRADGGHWSIDGDPTEGALIVAAAKADLDARLENERYPRVDVIPFESELAFMATLHHDHAGHGFIYVKGAPERVLDMCTHERHGGDDVPLDAQAWRARVSDLAQGGQRVLACACKPADARRELRMDEVQGGLTLLGLAGMVDPPREEAIRAVGDCHAAGIGVKMITGDHAVTASAIAARLRIGDGRSAVTGRELETADDARLAQLVPRVDVYARVSPEHKLRLVQALQGHGDIVAMTGDGVNDAPALKRADVGVAMGITGTEVAKEAADIVLADDNFASIVNAVEEGRTVYDNLRKTLLFIMPTNAAEAFVLIAAIVFGLALPILPVQILWVNMVTAVTLALALAFDPTEPDTMRRPPRDPDAPIFSRYFLWRTGLVAAVAVAGTLWIFLSEQARGASLEGARTAAVNTLVMFEAFYLLNSRFLTAPASPARALAGNPYVPLAIAAVIALQLLYTYAPFMQVLFQGEGLGAGAWVRVVLVALSVYVVVEIEKTAVRALRLRVV